MTVVTEHGLPKSTVPASSPFIFKQPCVEYVLLILILQLRKPNPREATAPKRTANQQPRAS